MSVESGGSCRRGDTMEGMASVWSYQQSIEELKHTLLCTTLELESTQMAVEEEKRRNNENVKQLLQLLKVAFQERDEAKDQLQMILNSILQSNPMEPIIPAKGNSSITESDSLSETYNRHSYVSSPVNSVFDTVTSPDLSNINMTNSSNILASNQPFLHLNEYIASSSNGISSGVNMVDPASAIIDQIVVKKPLPEKGKLLQAVMEAGPLLQTLLVAGPLPQWRNPPPLQSFQVPPISIEGHNSAELFQKRTVNSTCPADSSSASYHLISNGASRVCSTSMLNFPSAVRSYMMKRPMLSYGVGDGFANDPSSMAKRRKFLC